MISNKTRHLFQRVVSLGCGSAFQSWAVQRNERAKYYTNRLARQFQCPTDSQDLVKCLKKVNINSLVAAQLNLLDWFPFPPM
jgi:carboxylesterase type B